MMSDTSRELLADFRGGSEEAADQIFHRYVLRLTALARMRLSERIARRVDPEDIVLSAYRSFFVSARNGRFELDSKGDLWRLLVSITLHKLYRHVATNKRLKRSIGSESSNEDVDFIASHDPTPEEVLTASEELEAVLKELSPLARRVIELRLQGETLEKIAIEISRNERTVRRILDDARLVFRKRLKFAQDDSRLKNEKSEARPDIAFQKLAKISVEPTPNQTKKPSSVSSSILEFPTQLQQLPYGDFLLERFVGSGGSGKVYRARERSSGHHRAVKFLRKSFQSNATAIRRFITEASTMIGLRHEGIAHLYGLGVTSRGGYFMVSDWYPGGDVNRQLLAGKVSVKQAIKWVREAADAVQYLHEHGLVHCDLKPSNLLINQQGGIVVTDFGLARSISVDGHWSIEGTAGYMALEQAVPGMSPIGPQTDVFGLGAVLYALLTGRPPITGTRPSDVLAKLISGVPIERPAKLRAEIPQEVEDLCLECLNRDPTQRPSSARELAERLQGLETGFANL